MGIRSLTYVYDNQDRKILNLYRQYDGYPSGHGIELAEILRGRTIVNGYGTGTPAKASNGMGCLAATIVSDFKHNIGGFYIYSVDVDDCGQDYEYHVHLNSVTVKSYGEVLFSGDWEAFYEFCCNDD